MEPVTIYHNPRCSKSRQALELLRSQGLSPHVVEYLKTPLTLEQIQQLKAHFPLNEFVRCNESVFGELNLSLDNATHVLQAVAQHPILMQRPILTQGNRALIARPPEKILDWLLH